MEAARQLRLRDIHLPDPISWWPPAPGWWGILALLIFAALCIRFMVGMRRRRRVRVAALNALQKLSSDFAERQDDLWLVKEISVLLRRICLSYFPRVDVAALTGENWLRFLDERLGEKKWRSRFREGPGRALITAPYQAEAAVDAEALLALCGEWIKALLPLRNTR